VVGPTGSGKSSTINALFGQNVATVGTGFDPETQVITEYKLENLTLWDCPGPGDNPERDEANERDMAAKLKETDENGELIVDLVLVVLDASQRDMSATYLLLENMVLPILGEEAERRVLIGINKIDLLRNGRGWDFENARPKEELCAYIEAKKDSVFRRLYEATGQKIMVAKVHNYVGSASDSRAVQFFRSASLLDGGMVYKEQILGSMKMLLTKGESYSNYGLQKAGKYQYGREKYSTSTARSDQWSIQSNMEGKIFYLVDDKATVNTGDWVAILTDAKDTRKAVMAWYETQKKNRERGNEA
jgi:GTP-binding protein EngB required for normal cell division